MTSVKTIAIGAAGLVALVGASAPAAAQYYPGYNYPNSGNVIGQVLNSVLNPYASNGYNQYGYGQYGYNQYGNQYGYGYGVNTQMATQQCTAAVQQRLNNRGYSGGYGAYGGYSNAHVLGITRIDQRSNTTLRVRGYATSGMNYGGYPYGGYGGYGGYGANSNTADLTFKCDVDYRGYVRDIDIDRRY